MYISNVKEKTISVGIDIGKRHDPTAIVVAVAEKADGMTHYTIPFLRRLPLDTGYPEQANMLAEYCRKAIEKFVREPRVYVDRKPKIYADVTGVGDAVIDLLKPRVAPFASIRSCRFVSGDRFTKHGKEYSIGKAYFVGRLQVLAESKRIHLPKIAEARQLAQEMLDFDIDIDDASGKVTYGAIRPGTHDDMVCAMGLACLVDLPKWM